MSDARAQQLFHDVLIEASKACGDDPLAIGRYVAERVAALSPEDRALFNGVAESASAYDGPQDPSKFRPN